MLGKALYQSNGKPIPNVMPLVRSLLKKKKGIVEKGENAGNQHFLLFPYFFTHLKD